MVQTANSYSSTMLIYTLFIEMPSFQYICVYWCILFLFKWRFQIIGNLYFTTVSIEAVSLTLYQAYRSSADAVRVVLKYISVYVTKDVRAVGILQLG